MDKNFNVSFTKLADLEGVISNSAIDRGGLTKYGVTHTEYDAWRDRMGQARQSVTLMPLSEARLIFYNNYWLPMGCKYLPSGLDFAVFQAGVNIGAQTAVMILQGILGVKRDGVVGPVTMNAIAQRPLDPLITDFLEEQKARYDQIVANHVDQVGNHAGWYNRVADSLAFIQDNLLGVATGGTFF